MTHQSTHAWSYLRCKARAITCYFILRGKKVALVSFSPAAHKKARILLSRRGLTVTPLTPESPLALLVQHSFSEYLAGRRRTLLPPDCNSPFWQEGTPFQHRVWEEINRIPYGATITYGELARRLGNPHGARAVGQACHANPLALIVPCHRVVSALGLGGFAGGIHVKERLLATEQQATTGKSAPTPRPS